jgi:hypothetical protein
MSIESRRKDMGIEQRIKDDQRREGAEGHTFRKQEKTLR